MRFNYGPIRARVMQWLFPNCDIDIDIDRVNAWNVLERHSNQIKELQDRVRELRTSVGDK